jgi:hypothetical protein
VGGYTQSHDWDESALYRFYPERKHQPASEKKAAPKKPVPKK